MVSLLSAPQCSGPRLLANAGIVLEFHQLKGEPGMSVVLTETEPREAYLTIHLSPAINLTDEQFFELCQINGDLRFERTAKGDVIIMPPTGGETSNRNSEINRQLGNWAKRDRTGAAFDSSAGL